MNQTSPPTTPRSLAHKLLAAHCETSLPPAGEEVALRIDQTLTQDATGTMVMLELEAMGLERRRTEVSVQYVDHNLIQQDHRNPDDHLFLMSACRRFGVWYSRPGNGVSHPVHMQRFGKPGKSLLGSDSHTPAAGALGMLAFGAGGLEVAMAMAGEPYHVPMPSIWGIRLEGRLPAWVGAKDVILELLRRHGVRGGVGRILEFSGPGLDDLDAWDRHVIANMGTELGATTSVFPSDHVVRELLAYEGRADDFAPLAADEGAAYDVEEVVDLSALEPLIAKPSSPGNVVPVSEVAGEEIYQAYLGSSANPGYRDFALPAMMVEGRHVHPRVSFDVNPTTRSVVADLANEGLLQHLILAGARLHQAGCNGCIGMGQAPATGRNSLRTTPRNFPGRSGTKEDSVWLCSPATATASALAGCITDPRTLGDRPPRVAYPERPARTPELLVEPPTAVEAVELIKGPNVVSLPELDRLDDVLDLPVLLQLGDDVSTDEIMPAGSRVLPYRSNIPKIADFCFEVIDDEYPTRARAHLEQGGHAIVAGDNYGQGSSREHAALAPRSLGLRLVVAKSFARIHRQNLVCFGVLPLVFSDPSGYEEIKAGDRLRLRRLRKALAEGSRIEIETSRGRSVPARHDLSSRQVAILLAGGLINRQRRQG